MKRFAVYPQWVQGAWDDDWHFISASQLMRLYQVKPHECVVIDPESPQTLQGITEEYLSTLMPLTVRYTIGYRPVSTKERAMWPK